MQGLRITRRAQSNANLPYSAQISTNICGRRHIVPRSQSSLNCATRMNTGDGRYNCSTWNNFGGVEQLCPAGVDEPTPALSQFAFLFVIRKAEETE